MNDNNKIRQILLKISVIILTLSLLSLSFFIIDTIISKKDVIVFGDSIAKLIISDKAINKGVGSETTLDLIARLNNDVILQKPKKVIIIAGINDIYKDWQPEITINNLEYIIKKLKNNNINDIVLFTIGPHKLNTAEKIAKTKKINEWIKQKTNQIVVYDYWSMANNPEKDGFPSVNYYLDAVHPNNDFILKIKKDFDL